MATKTFYWLPDTAAGTTAFGSLQDGGIAPVTADSNSKFKVGTTAATAYAKYFRNTTRQPTDFNATVQPDGSFDLSHGDCLRTQNAYRGQFASGNWTFHTTLDFNNVGSAGSVALRFRLYRSTDPGGANATEITSGTLQASPDDTVAAGGQLTKITTFNPGALSLNNEYLFLEVALVITGTHNNASAIWTIYVGSGQCDIITTNYTDDPANLLDQKQHTAKKKRYRKKRGPKKRSRWQPPDGIVVVQPFPFQWKKKKWQKKKPPKRKRRDRLEYIAITIGTMPPGFPFKPRRKVRLSKGSYAGGRRKRLRQWQNAPLPHLQYQPALCGHTTILPILAAKVFLMERDSGREGILEALTATARAFECRSAPGKILETMTATATLICCK